jgi:SagB-type dehydrogenase family enzyme
MPVESKIELPKPSLKSDVSLERTLARRRSIREFRDEPLTREQLSQLLWSLQGITDREGDRTAPSAGALFPLETYVATAEGLYHYDPRRHELTRRAEGDLRPALHRAALEQDSIVEAPAVFVVAAVHDRIERKYGPARTPRYVHMEVGHAGQNLLLQAVALGLGSVPIGAFHDARVQKVLGLPADHKPLYLLPVGKPR